MQRAFRLWSVAGSAIVSGAVVMRVMVTAVPDTDAPDRRAARVEAGFVAAPRLAWRTAPRGAPAPHALPLGGPLPPLRPRFPAYELDNGLMRLRMNDGAPIVSWMWVSGALAVPFDNVGAAFQIATRSEKGDAYNPTLGGDCSGTPSVLLDVVEHWNALEPGTPARHGLLFEVQPRNYNEPRYPGCHGPGELLPYNVGPEESASHPRAGTVGCDPAVMSEINAPSIQAQKAAIQRISQRRL